MSKKISDDWKSLPEEKKQKYIELSHQEQEANAVGINLLINQFINQSINKEEKMNDI